MLTKKKEIAMKTNENSNQQTNITHDTHVTDITFTEIEKQKKSKNKAF